MYLLAWLAEGILMWEHAASNTLPCLLSCANEKMCWARMVCPVLALSIVVWAWQGQTPFAGLQACLGLLTPVASKPQMLFTTLYTRAEARVMHDQALVICLASIPMMPAAMQMAPPNA